MSALGFGKKKDEHPSFKEQVETQTKGDIEVNEALRDDAMGGNLREFYDLVLTEDKYSIYFTVFQNELVEGKLVYNPLYSPAYEPFRLFFSRLIRLGLMTEEDVWRWKQDVHSTAQRCYVLAKTRLEHFIIDSMEKYLCTVIPTHAMQGHFFKTLTTNRKILQMFRGEEEKKRGFFHF